MHKEVKCNIMLMSNRVISGILWPLETLRHWGTALVRKLLDLQHTKFVFGTFLVDTVLLMAVFKFL
jgi:hypothetical protein